MSVRLNKSQQEKLAAYEPFFQQLETKYKVTREEILQAVCEQGLIKGRIDAYFLVKRHQQRMRDLRSFEEGENLPPVL